MDSFQIVTPEGHYLEVENDKVLTAQCAFFPGISMAKVNHPRQGEGWEISVRGDEGKALNQSGGPAIGHEVGLWNTGDIKNLLEFQSVF